MVYVIFVSIVAPLIMLTFFLKKEARLIFGFMIIGIAVALMSYELNSILNNLLPLSSFDFTILITPITEELLKAISILIFALLVSDKKQIILGISMAIGIGFAVLENSYLLVENYQNINIAWAVVRGFAAGIMHGISSSIVGYGMIFVNKQKKLFYTGIFGLLTIAVMYHSIYNMLVQSNYYYIGFIMPITTYVIMILSANKDKLIENIKRISHSK